MSQTPHQFNNSDCNEEPSNTKKELFLSPETKTLIQPSSNSLFDTAFHSGHFPILLNQQMPALLCNPIQILSFLSNLIQIMQHSFPPISLLLLLKTLQIYQELKLQHHLVYISRSFPLDQRLILLHSKIKSLKNSNTKILLSLFQANITRIASTINKASLFTFADPSTQTSKLLSLHETALFEKACTKTKIFP